MQPSWEPAIQNADFSPLLKTQSCFRYRYGLRARFVPVSLLCFFPMVVYKFFLCGLSPSFATSNRSNDQAPSYVRLFHAHGHSSRSLACKAMRQPASILKNVLQSAQKILVFRVRLSDPAPCSVLRLCASSALKTWHMMMPSGEGRVHTFCKNGSRLGRPRHANPFEQITRTASHWSWIFAASARIRRRHDVSLGKIRSRAFFGGPPRWSVPACSWTSSADDAGLEGDRPSAFPLIWFSTHVTSLPCPFPSHQRST